MNDSSERLAQWLYKTTPRRSDVGRFSWDALPEFGCGGKMHHREWASALLASEEWLTREAVVRMARSEHEACDGKADDEDETVPCGMCGALARLAAVRGTT